MVETTVLSDGKGMVLILTSGFQVQKLQTFRDYKSNFKMMKKKMKMIMLL